MNKWKWLAKISGKDSDGKPKISTGVPLGPRLILTSGHGVPSKTDAKVEILFIDDIKREKPIRPAKVVWHGVKHGKDATLLQLDVEDSDIQYWSYTKKEHSGACDWEGAGFADAGIFKDGKADVTGVSGKCHFQGGQVQDVLQLEVSFKPKDISDWHGMSGGPVVVDDELVGIIATYSEKWDGSQFKGVPIQSLMKIEDFREHIHSEDRNIRLELVKNKIKDILDLYPKIKMEFQRKVKGLSANPNSRVITEALLNSNLETFIKICWEVFRDLPDTSHQSRVTEILEHSLPTVYPYQEVDVLRPMANSALMLKVPAATKTVIEIMMAALDERPTDFRKPIEPRGTPFGNPWIQEKPETGGNNNDVTAFHNYMDARFVPEDDRDQPWDQRLGIINDYLNDLAEGYLGYSYRYYVICGAGTDDVENLMQNYPNLRFILLEGGNAREERKTIRGIQFMFQRVKSKGDNIEVL